MIHHTGARTLMHIRPVTALIVVRHATPCPSCGARWVNVGTSSQARHHTPTCALRTNQRTTDA